jgi:hypothetical protein
VIGGALVTGGFLPLLAGHSNHQFQATEVIR